jgi:hypothetical protein
MIVAIICMSVVLPAPLGPSNPITPDFTSRERSRTPKFPARNLFETLSILSTPKYGQIGLAYQDRSRHTRAMKAWLTILFLISFLFAPAFAAPSSKGRRITELKVIPTRVLERSVSRKFFKSLLISPVEGWIMVRAQVSGAKLTGMRVTKSDLNGAYDPIALKLASEVRLSGNFATDRAHIPPPVLFHLLIYQIADGTMALSFAHFDEPGGDQMAYYGCAKLMVRKSDGSWTEIEGPEGLQGKGWAVQQGPKNTVDALKTEMISKSPEATNMNAGPGR